MARGIKKTIEEKVSQKQELINALMVRLESEQNELEELLNEQKRQEIDALYVFIKKSNLDISEAVNVLQQHLEEQYNVTA